MSDRPQYRLLVVKSQPVPQSARPKLDVGPFVKLGCRTAAGHGRELCAQSGCSNFCKPDVQMTVFIPGGLVCVCRYFVAGDRLWSRRSSPKGCLCTHATRTFLTLSRQTFLLPHCLAMSKLLLLDRANAGATFIMAGKAQGGANVCLQLREAAVVAVHDALRLLYAHRQVLCAP